MCAQIELLTVENDDAEYGEVEEDSRPRRRVDHGEDDGEDEDDDLHEKGPHHAARQGPAAGEKKSV